MSTILTSLHGKQIGIDKDVLGALGVLFVAGWSVFSKKAA